MFQSVTWLWKAAVQNDGCVGYNFGTLLLNG